MNAYGSSIESEMLLHSPVRGSSMVSPGIWMTEAITITSLARNTGVSTKTLRYWESLGLLPETSRTHSGYRLFSKGMIRYVQFIRESKGLGLTLKEIRSAIGLFRKGKNPCPAVAKSLQLRCTELEKQIRSLQELKDRAERLRRKWARDPDNFCFWETGLCLSSCDCPDSERVKRERPEETAGGFRGAVRSASRQRQP